MTNTSAGDPGDELVRLKVLELRRESGSQSDLIVEMNRVGFGNARIAELLGTTANTVSVVLAKKKKKDKTT